MNKVLQTRSRSRSAARLNVAIVGASGGIGREIAETYRGENAALYLSANRGFESLRNFTTDPDFPSANLFQADLSQTNAGDKLADEILARISQNDNNGSDPPRLDALVVAVGIDLMTKESKALEFNARLERAWKIDVAATIALTRALGQAMANRRDAELDEAYAPSLVLFGCNGVGRAQENETAQIYSTCKGAVVAFAKSFAQELDGKARINTVSPGWIRTAWGAQASATATERAQRESLEKRWGTAKEVAKVVRFLLAEDASYVNGQDVQVDGGYSYRRK